MFWAIDDFFFQFHLLLQANARRASVVITAEYDPNTGLLTETSVWIRAKTLYKNGASVLN